ncbi:MAG TPA: aldo/keto reductase [Bacillota bacterium]|nr:aldo/keto reductase [Bacillota bacterium]
MQYRTMNSTGEQISLLGFGTMRLPVIDGVPANIDEAETIKMLRSAIDRGVNYVDTAYPYHGGKSEVAVGKALKDGYREKVFLADKLPLWLVKSENDLDRIFGEQLQRLGTDSIDMYLAHNLDRDTWPKVAEFNVMRFLERKRAEGKIKYIGFSFHDEFDLFQEIIKSYPWDFCQIQLNYMDENFQAGVKGLRLAASLNIPVIVMEPLKGGKLTDTMPRNIQELWDKAPVRRTPAEWAFRWVADFPEVLTILSGMNTMEQVEENLRILSGVEPGSLTEAELKIIGDVADEYNRLIPHSCTGCEYCMPCPAGINIPNIIARYNDWHVYEENPKIKRDFKIWVPESGRPSVCMDCKACEGHCPQHLPVSEIMKKATEIFE